MKYGYFWKRFGAVGLPVVFFFNAAVATSDSLNANISLLDLTDRGSITKTPYVLAPFGIMFEAGYQTEHFSPDGTWNTFPQPFFFLGIPGHSELIFELPSYNQEPKMHFSGFSPAVIGVKHEFGVGPQWMAAVHLLLELPSGNDAFGTQGLGANLNGMLSYKINPIFTMGFMFGAGTLVESPVDGGERFNTVSSSFVLTYAPTEHMSLFAEVFGQTKTSLVEGGNFNADCGLLYLLRPNVLFDFELGQQLSHIEGNFRQFISSGITLKF